jgi:hypothetical protein
MGMKVMGGKAIQYKMPQVLCPSFKQNGAFALTKDNSYPRGRLKQRGKMAQ